MSEAPSRASGTRAGPGPDVRRAGASRVPSVLHRPGDQPDRDLAPGRRGPLAGVRADAFGIPAGGRRGRGADARAGGRPAGRRDRRPGHAAEDDPADGMRPDAAGAAAGGARRRRRRAGLADGRDPGPDADLRDVRAAQPPGLLLRAGRPRDAPQRDRAVIGAIQRDPGHRAGAGRDRPDLPGRGRLLRPERAQLRGGDRGGPVDPAGAAGAGPVRTRTSRCARCWAGCITWGRTDGSRRS